MRTCWCPCTRSCRPGTTPAWRRAPSSAPCVCTLTAVCTTAVSLTPGVDVNAHVLVPVHQKLPSWNDTSVAARAELGALRLHADGGLHNGGVVDPRRRRECARVGARAPEVAVLERHQRGGARRARRLASAR